MIPQFSTMLFKNFFTGPEDFLNKYKTSGLYIEGNTITDSNAIVLFNLLYAKYGNSPIINRDVNQFKARLWSTVYMYGPIWQRKQEVQEKLRNLSEDEILVASKVIANSALNPDNEPGTSSLEELLYISQQNTNTGKRGKLDAYYQLQALLTADHTTDFINRFGPLFKQFVEPERPLLYVYDEEPEDGND